MTLKDIVWNLTPPIVVKLWHKIRGDINEQNVTTKKTDKELIFEYINEVNRRKSLPFNDIESLSKEFNGNMQSLLCLGTYEPSNYGAFHVLSEYAGLLMGIAPRNFTIQHGFHLEGTISNDLFEGIKHYLCWGKTDKDYFSKQIKDMVIDVIGTPFLYAKSLLSEEEILQEKKRLGRNLLAFPSHSLTKVGAEFNVEDFVEVLKQEEKKFDTVRVCLYWADIFLGHDKIYRDNGFECVCSGNIADLFFLNRQKSLFEIADCTISNDMGSHVGYSLIMGKPHNLINQKIESKFLDGFYSEIEYFSMQKIHDVSRENAKKLFENNFNYKITKEQLDFVDMYWGVSDKKSPSEIYKFLTKSL